MKDLKTFEEILEFAINLEEKAISFYNGLGEKVSSPVVKQSCKDLAAEEMKHKEKLESIRQQSYASFPVTTVSNLEIAEVLKDIDFSQKDFSYQAALTLAMKREKFSYELYSQLANDAQDASLKELFQFLAQEEAAHKHKIEVEYDDIVLKDN